MCGKVSPRTYFHAEIFNDLFHDRFKKAVDYLVGFSVFSLVISLLVVASCISGLHCTDTPFGWLERPFDIFAGHLNCGWSVLPGLEGSLLAALGYSIVSTVNSAVRTMWML